VAVITSNATGGGYWSAGATWAGGVAPVNNDTVVIAAGDTVSVDIDMSAYANGIAGITITGHATDPGMLTFKNDADGIYALKLKTGTSIVGTNTAALGRILANSDSVWGNTGQLPFGRKAWILLEGTATVNAQYLDLRFYCDRPVNEFVTAYGTKFAVSSIDTGTDIITMDSAHGWADDTPVMVRSSGTLPGGLSADAVYYVSSASGAALKLLSYKSGPAVDITSAGTGTIEIYNGHTSTSTATLNVFEDLTADPQWEAGAAVVLVNTNAPAAYDQQRTTLASTTAASVTLGSNVDSAQFPAAKVFLATRNVAIRSNTTTSTQRIVQNGTGGVFDCEIRSTAGTGTTFYGYGLYNCGAATVSGTVSGCSSGVYSCSAATVSGTVSGCNNGLYSCSAATVSGTVSGCNNGLSGCSAATVSGTVSGCNNGLSGCSTATILGTVSGCNNGLNGCTTATILGTVSGCSSGVYSCSAATVSGTVSGCSSGVYSCSAATVSGTVSGCNNGLSGCSAATVSGTVSGCNNGLSGCSAATVSGTVSGCSFGLDTCASFLLLNTASFTNITDIYRSSGQAYGTSLNGATQVDVYKHVDNPTLPDFRYGITAQDLGDTGYGIGFWTLGGYCKTAAYAEGTHGTPPVVTAYVHEQVFEDSDRSCWVELPIWAPAGRQITLTFYGKLTGTSSFLTRPKVGIYDPGGLWLDASEELSVQQVANDTDWHTHTITYTAGYDREVRLKVWGIGGNAGGTGTEKLYWFHTLAIAGEGGGGGGGAYPVIGSSIVRSIA